MKQKITVTLIKSTIGRLRRHRNCVRGLGLRKVNHTVQVDDTPQNRGMIKKVEYMLNVK